MRPSPCFSFRTRTRLLRAHHDAAALTPPIQKAIEAAYYRGGTSRAVIVQPHHLPPERAKWSTIFRQIMGSGDPYGRQLDGMGAGISSLSKICLVEPYDKRIPPLGGMLPPKQRGYFDATKTANQVGKAQEEARESGEEQNLDIDYTFVGLGIENDEVDMAGNCGNMSSAIGPYAYNAGLLSANLYAQGDRDVTVKIRNTNTGKFIDSTFKVVDGQAAVAGDYTIDGVTGHGSMIKLDFKHPYGSKTGKVLPTKNIIDHIAGYEVSCVDGANPAIFIRADDVGVAGTILPNDFNKLSDKLKLLEHVRKTAAVAMGIATTEDLVPRTIPKIGLVSRSAAHPVLSGQTLETAQTDIVIRFLSDTQPHRAIPLTAALTTAVAARIPGTIVEQMIASKPVMEGAITIGHASGRLQVDATMDEEDKTLPVSATVYRTAKRLFEGRAFWTENGGTEEAKHTKYGSNGTHSRGLAFVLENRGQDSSNLFQSDLPEATTVAQQDSTHEAPQSSEPTNLPQDSASKISTESLKTALQRLKSQVNHLLSDPDMASRPYPPSLVKTLEISYNRIANSSQARSQTVQGMQWKNWAKGLHKQKKSLRDKVEKEEKKKARADKGVKRTTMR